MSFTVRAGETLAMVGESGSGKSLTGLAIMGVLPPSAYVSQGSAWLQGHNLLRLDNAAFRRVRGGVMSMIFPDPLSSLNPVHRIGAQIAEAMRAHFEVPHYEAKEEVEALLAGSECPIPSARLRLSAWLLGRHAATCDDCDGDRQRSAATDRRWNLPPR